MPELKLGKTANEWTELVVLFRWQTGRGVAILHALVLRKRRVEFGL